MNERPPPGFPTPWPSFTIEPNGDPEYSTESSSQCETATVTDITYYVEYDIDDNDSTVTTSTYSTDSSVITACSAEATTTTEYSTSTLQYCTPGCVECYPARRDLAPTPPPEVLNRKTSDLTQYGSKLASSKRDVPNLDSSETWSGLYQDVQRAANTVTVQLAYNGLLGISSSGYITFDDAEHNLYVDSLAGCTSVIVVNRAGELTTFLHFILCLLDGPGRFFETTS
jgi:hypothetical protein